jgi:mRNA interferase RelE/StbE
MPLYKIEISETAIKQLNKLPQSVSQDLITVIQLLSENPRPYGYKKLKGRKGYRIRKGNYRIIYDVYNKILVIDIIAVGHRKDIYD